MDSVTRERGRCGDKESSSRAAAAAPYRESGLRSTAAVEAVASTKLVALSFAGKRLNLRAREDDAVVVV